MQRKSKFTFATEEINSSTNVNDRLLPEKFSSFSRLLRITAWVKRFLKNCQLPNEQRKKNNVLQRAEISDAETFWIRRTQAEAFPNGEKENCLTRFCPQRDEDGLLRISGRLRFADDLPHDVKHPIILPKDHPVTRLIIENRHEKIGHKLSGTSSNRDPFAFLDHKRQTSSTNCC